jgi:hypothetical protein
MLRLLLHTGSLEPLVVCRSRVVCVVFIMCRSLLVRSFEILIGGAALPAHLSQTSCAPSSGLCGAVPEVAALHFLAESTAAAQRQRQQPQPASSSPALASYFISKEGVMSYDHAVQYCAGSSYMGLDWEMVQLQARVGVEGEVGCFLTFHCMSACEQLSVFPAHRGALESNAAHPRSLHILATLPLPRNQDTLDWAASSWTRRGAHEALTALGA